MNGQIEFADVNRGQRARPGGTWEFIKGWPVFSMHSQTVKHVAFTTGYTREHICHLIHQGEFPNAIEGSSTTAGKPNYRIPRQDVVDFINLRKEGA